MSHGRYSVSRGAALGTAPRTSGLALPLLLLPAFLSQQSPALSA